METPVALPVVTRKRGNPDWRRPMQPAAVLATEFELPSYSLTTHCHHLAQNNPNHFASTGLRFVIQQAGGLR
jgi:hypothetical protein